MHDQTNDIIWSNKKLKGTKPQENNNIETKFAQYLHILKLLN